MNIRSYTPQDEQGWVRCRILSFLDTAYYDNVLREKETYENPAIELVAEIDNIIVGLIDIEYELQEGTICTRKNGIGGMIWHIAVHPDYQRRGIGFQLLQEAEKIAKEKGIDYLEAWTRDDEWVNSWYVKNSFHKFNSYLHVYMEGNQELDGVLTSNMEKLYPVQAFAHYVGEEKEKVKRTFKRVHECNGYEKQLS